MSHPRNHIGSGARLWIAANKIYIYDLVDLKKFEADLLILKDQYKNIFINCLNKLVMLKNDELFFYLIELAEDSVRFDQKYIAFSSILLWAPCPCVATEPIR